MFYQMTAIDYFTTLTAAANVTKFQEAGYTLEIVEGDDETYVKLTALTAVEGEELSWIVYAYPYRSAADQKFELAQLLEATTGDQTLINEARAILYNTDATAAEVAAAIASLTPEQHESGVYIAESAPAWTVATDKRSIIVLGATGSSITVYQITGHIVASVSAKSDAVTIAAPAAGIYIVRVNDAAVKVLVK
jgi:hypothetical protein